MSNTANNQIKKNYHNKALISVVLPIYYCDIFLEELYERLKTSLSSITEHYELIFVEDCGKDNSWAIISRLCDMDSRVKGIRFSRNFGQHYAITAGLDYSNGEWVVIMDGDLQDRPEDIVRLYEKAQEGYEVVLARRANREYPLFQSITSWFFYKFFNFFTEMNYDSRVGNFRIISRKVVNSYRQMREQLRFFGGLIDWLGFESVYVDVEHAKRSNSKSSYSFAKRWKLATEAIIAYSDKPLKLSVQIGFLMSASAFAYGAYIIYRALFLDIPLAGWASLIVSLYFIGGIIISILGILGIYLGKTFDEVKKRPLYVVNKLKNIKGLGLEET
jgi:polyisoprenyl-phosphate glycosyltransferase